MLDKEIRTICAFYRLDDYLKELMIRTGENQPKYELVSKIISNLSHLSNYLGMSQIELLKSRKAYKESWIYPHNKLERKE